MKREGESVRETEEVKIRVHVTLDGEGKFEGNAGTIFMNHMLKTFAKHSKMDIKIEAHGDLKHHVIEDIAIAMGRAINNALKEKEGIARFGFAYVPMDDSLARAAVDLGGRAYCKLDLNIRGEVIEDTKVEDVMHFIETLSQSLQANVHIAVLYGTNDHHKMEAAMKALAISIREAVKVLGKGIPSAKGVIG